MPWLKRLTIHKFPRVKPGTELVFNEGSNVLLGINGSGKTTLLKLLSMVCSGTLGGVRNFEFDVTYEYATSRSGARYVVDLRHEGDEQSKVSKTYGRLTVFGVTAEPMVVDVAAGTATVSHGTRIIEGMAWSSGLDESFAAAALLLLVDKLKLRPPELNALELVDTLPVARFDESVGWLNESLERGKLGLLRRVTNVQVFSSISTPFSVQKAVLRRFEADNRGDLLTLGHEDLDFLAQAVDVFGYVGASMRLDLLQGTEYADEATFRYGRYEFRFTKRDGSRLSHTDLSFGQQRLFAFLYYAAMHPHIVIADELTNGMHHSMIERCLEVVKGRQAFFATQNPLLLDNLEFADVEEVRRTFILCSNVEADGEEHMVWRNMTGEEAENFYRDYKVGISHVNDILRSWGLW